MTNNSNYLFKGKISLLLAFAVLFLSASATAQNCIPFNGSNIYSQNFDGLGLSPAPQTGDISNILDITNLPPLASNRVLGKFDNATADNGNPVNIPGWAVIQEGPDSNIVTGRYAVENGSSTVSNIYSYGSAGASDRALGSLIGTSMTSSYIGACFQYTGLTTAFEVRIAFTGEVWRYGGGRGPQNPDKLSFQYAVNANNLFDGNYVPYPALDFLTPNSAGGSAGNRDGNHTPNRRVIPFTTLPLTLHQGDRLYIRWHDEDVAGNEDGMAIDDFMLALTPLAAGAVVEGRVLLGKNGIPNTLVTLTGKDGTSRTVVTNSFGIFRFEDVPAGEIYFVSVMNKRYQFENPTQTISVSGDIEDLVFTAIP
jgi:hypothetical protein